MTDGDGGQDISARPGPGPGVPDAGPGPSAAGDRAVIASVVIPAHDEQAVIGRLLDALGEGQPPGAIEVVVACNGCTDDTAAVARARGAHVVEVPAASKIAALDAGDAAATAFPRFYVDADVVLTGRAVADVARWLADDGDGVPCAAPPFDVAVDGRPWAVRAFYDVWLRTPYLADAHVGSGVFALSQAGRARFGHFPGVIADDLFVRNLFGRAERRVVATDPFVIEAPRTLRALVRRRVRVHAGNLEQAAHAELRSLPGARESCAPWWRTVVERPSLAARAVPYALVNAIAKLRARQLVRGGREIGWRRDETTREPPAPRPTPPPSPSPDRLGAST
jgi:glycosyltransferase involved in cell wall biosynthesis